MIHENLSLPPNVVLVVEFFLLNQVNAIINILKALLQKDALGLMGLISLKHSLLLQ